MQIITLLTVLLAALPALSFPITFAQVAPAVRLEVGEGMLGGPTKRDVLDDSEAVVEAVVVGEAAAEKRDMPEHGAIVGLRSRDVLAGLISEVKKRDLLLTWDVIDGIQFVEWPGCSAHSPSVKTPGPLKGLEAVREGPFVVTSGIKKRGVVDDVQAAFEDVVRIAEVATESAEASDNLDYVTGDHLLAGSQDEFKARDHLRNRDDLDGLEFDPWPITGESISAETR